MATSAEWTNNEASATKLYLAQNGYINDPFMEHFCRQSKRRTPEIHRGYFARTYAITRSVSTFCLREGASAATAHIVNIGAGFETLFWRLASEPEIRFAKYVDIDMPDVIEHKIRAINSHDELLKPCGTVMKSTANEFRSEKYCALAQDATKPLQLIRKLTDLCKIRPADPILFVFECVLLYWDEESTISLIHALNRTFPKCNLAIFDLINTRDRFSQVMQQSLIEQGTPLMGAAAFETLADWDKKLRSNGFGHVNAWNMSHVYQNMIDEREKRRIENIEFLDEIELLFQLFDHYCLILASNYSEFDWNPN